MLMGLDLPRGFLCQFPDGLVEQQLAELLVGQVLTIESGKLGREQERFLFLEGHPFAIPHKLGSIPLFSFAVLLKEPKHHPLSGLGFVDISAELFEEEGIRGLAHLSAQGVDVAIHERHRIVLGLDGSRCWGMGERCGWRWRWWRRWHDDHVGWFVAGHAYNLSCLRICRLAWRLSDLSSTW